MRCVQVAVSAQRFERESRKHKSLYGESDSDDERPLEGWLDDLEKDPTPNGLGSLLADDADKVIDEAKDSWLVLELYGPGVHVVLPMELATENELEDLMQNNIDEQASTGSNENLRLSNAWLQHCLANHTRCAPDRQDPWLPSRLIDVGTVKNETVRLVLGSSLDIRSPYAALSHRWGRDTTFVLTSAKLAAYQQEITLVEGSSTLRDAIEVTRSLGLQYLWMDSMCIVQDDASDWARVSATMSKVYGLSTCTIAAANSGSDEGGCFAQRN
ncbi:heterokaryon incompatibility protein-domain-containing protein [Xylaria bambusicola]|uniref:heterokaryon incompatibility protein-domain-containing protein n=1 Tax=Xylaria bambusicola TaxID=326684 RepID=UPI0020075B86|nr:heterokaryon incompatibility protein-domain-containing protein [Xylaria bambusicola]KAI0512605.1 heterokaryon incompatibility protein-domain-containing protein [Xylaria bambusicola]